MNEKGQGVLDNKGLRWMEEEREKPTGWGLGKENLEVKIEKETFLAAGVN